jgi:chemotaxis methyl-accepting protein methylase
MTKKNKVKKPLPPPVLNQDDNNLVDDLLAQLDSQEKEAADLLNALTISESGKAPPTPPVQNQDDNNLVDDFLAQLDSQEKETADLLNALTISESDKAPPTQVQKQDVKSRFKARQVLDFNSSQVGF